MTRWPVGMYLVSMEHYCRFLSSQYMLIRSLWETCTTKSGLSVHWSTGRLLWRVPLLLLPLDRVDIELDKLEHPYRVNIPQIFQAIEPFRFSKCVLQEPEVIIVPSDTCMNLLDKISLSNVEAISWYPELGQKGEVTLNGRMQNTTKATIGTEKARYWSTRFFPMSHI